MNPNANCDPKANPSPNPNPTTRFKPHPRASLRPTMLHLHSDAYARRAYASRACASRGAGEVGVAGKRGRDEETLLSS